MEEVYDDHNVRRDVPRLSAILEKLSTWITGVYYDLDSILNNAGNIRKGNEFEKKWISEFDKISDPQTEIAIISCEMEKVERRVKNLKDEISTLKDEPTKRSD